VLDEDHRGRRREAAAWASTGHAAAVYGDELFELLRQTRGGYNRLQDFGIRFGYERVVIYLQPTVQPGRLEANIASCRRRHEAINAHRGGMPTCLRAARRARCPWRGNDVPSRLRHSAVLKCRGATIVVAVVPENPPVGNATADVALRRRRRG